MKYKIGDKVKIKSLDWYNKNKDEYGYYDAGLLFSPEMSKCCGKIAIIIEATARYYKLDIDKERRTWNDEMFEENVESKKGFATIPKSDIKTNENNSMLTEEITFKNVQSFDDICSELSLLHLRKNKDYGNVFSDMYKKFGITYPIIHLEEKLKRIESLQSASNEVKGETYVDSLKDLASYAIMTLIEIESKKTR